MQGPNGITKMLHKIVSHEKKKKKIKASKEKAGILEQSYD